MSQKISDQQAFFRQAAHSLKDLPDARQEARWLFEQVTGYSRTEQMKEPMRPLRAEDAQRLEQLLQRRASGEPLAYLLGCIEFFGRNFMVSPEVLVPRPETEQLVTLALEKLAERPAVNALDLGTGSGAVAVTLALESASTRWTATDISTSALDVARTNAEALGALLDFRAGSWFDACPPGLRYSLIVSNPPYIAEGDPHLNGDGVRFEPRCALTDAVPGSEGLACIAAIVAGAPAHLSPGGWLMFEHGYDQGPASRNLLQSSGFEAIFTTQDFAGHDRISGGRYLT